MPLRTYNNLMVIKYVIRMKQVKSSSDYDKIVIFLRRKTVYAAISSMPLKIICISDAHRFPPKIAVVIVAQLYADDLLF